MILVGMFILGAVLGACAMCVVSYKREQEYQSILARAHTRGRESLYEAEERKRYIQETNIE